MFHLQPRSVKPVPGPNVYWPPFVTFKLIKSFLEKNGLGSSDLLIAGLCEMEKQFSITPSMTAGCIWTLSFTAHLLPIMFCV